jgi:hypothetical protein
MTDYTYALESLLLAIRCTNRLDDTCQLMHVILMSKVHYNARPPFNEKMELIHSMDATNRVENDENDPIAAY